MGNYISNNITKNMTKNIIDSNNASENKHINAAAFCFDKTSTIDNKYIYKLDVDYVNKNNIDSIKQNLKNLNCTSIDNNLNEIIKSLEYLVNKESEGIIAQTDSFLFNYYNLPLLEIKNKNSNEYRKQNNIEPTQYKFNFNCKLHNLFIKKY